MPLDEKLANELGDAVGRFVNDWVVENHGGPVCGNAILSMLMTHAAKLIASAPDGEHRVSLFEQTVIALLSGSQADVAVLFFPANKVADGMLAASEVKGNA